jgi:hypothetical protein
MLLEEDVGNGIVFGQGSTFQRVVLDAVGKPGHV